MRVADAESAIYVRFASSRAALVRSERRHGLVRRRVGALERWRQRPDQDVAHAAAATTAAREAAGVGAILAPHLNQRAERATAAARGRRHTPRGAAGSARDAERAVAAVLAV